ncbi:tetratricopeptide repeat-containing sulfotransferase family protein [Neptunicella sp.]|uniref:tetratricopeptide repeat-containing sulfotransferase family protein n=1 Tax=Neptunicella sp. TaxID=2125986 RepID=UPI003F68DDFA
MPLSPSQQSAEQIERMLDNVWLAINQQNVAQAKKLSQEFNQAYSDNADGWFATSFLAFQLADFHQGLRSIEQSLLIEPTGSRWLLHKAHCLVMLGQRQHAQMIAEQLHQADLPVDAGLYAEFALVLSKLVQYELSAHYYWQAIQQTPDDPQLHFNLATVQRYLGRLDEAEQSLNQVIKLNPFDTEAYLLRADLRPQTIASNHIEQMQRLLQQYRFNDLQTSQINYALAKELEDIKQYSQSFTSLQHGALFRRKNIQYDVQRDVATINKIIQVFNKDCFVKPPAGYTNNEAIFILGLPRTGSTLIERILTHHTQVSSAGELNNFSLQMVAQCRRKLGQLPADRLELVEQTRHLDVTALGKAYIDSTRPETGHVKHFVDKLPLNSLNVGLIHLALPQAKIIHVQRHPLDTCYAIFKQLFVQGYPFSYDLDELASYYIAHHRLMQHWRDVIPQAIYTIGYENVVADIDTQAKQLIEHCQLDWQPQCSLVESNQAPSNTASASQVRRGIYNSSVAKWRHYEKPLAGLKQSLERAGIICD